MPWYVMGDFNNVLTVHNIIGGVPVHKKEYKDLIEMMERIGLYEKESKGYHFTWFNKHNIGEIYSMIDKVIGNASWHQLNVKLF